MLQSNMLPNDRTRGLPDEQVENSDFGGLVSFALGFLRRRYVLIFLTTAFAFTASIIYLRVTPPTYTSQVKILLGNPKAQFVQQQSVLAESPVDASQLETQIEILKSKAIALSVIDQLKLADDPDFKGSPGLLRSVSQAIRARFGSAPQEHKDDPTDGLVAAFDQRLSAVRLGYSTVIEVSFSASSAERAAQIANAVANAFMADQVNAKGEANRTATAWLNERLKELGEQALRAERAVNELKAKNNIVAAGGKLVDEQQVTELNSRLAIARAQTSEVSARLNRFEVILGSNSADSVSIDNLNIPGSESQNVSVINALRQQYLEYAAKEYEFSVRFGKDHMAVVNLRATMTALRAAILDEVRRIAATCKSDYEVAKQRQQEAEKQLSLAVSQSQTTSSADLGIRELETRAKQYRALYESFLQRYMGSVQQESFPISEARVISPATPPQSKSKPKSGLVLALGMLGGIALGVGLGFLREVMDRVFRTSAQVEATLQLPCLSLVPLLSGREPRKPSSDAAVQAGKDPNQRTLSRGSPMYWAATAMPLSRFAESIRAIKLGIDFASTKASNKVIGITSTLPNEGKSTIAASLAQLIAHAGKRIVLVDCDLRNPSLSTNLAPHASTSIIDVLSGARSLEETLWRDSRLSLEFLPAPQKTPLLNTSELLSTEEIKKLFDELRATFDYVIVDLPPLAPIVDVRATTPLIDCFVLVVEWGRTTTDVIQHALRVAPNVYDALAGAVLNKTDMKAIKRYDHYHGGYYNKEHYIRYGQITAE
jgi:succinoglycan biosynthesis transport protein ExoP